MTTKAPYLTSTTLVEAVRRRCSLPEADNFFNVNDILEFANEELLEQILPMIKATHEEYFVWNTIVPITSNQSKYEIPERALGNALRDLSYIDSSGNEYEMTRINRDDRYDTNSLSSSSVPYRFYVENNDIILTPESSNYSGSLKMTFLLRPNQLLESKYVAKVQNVSPSSVPVSSITLGNPTIVTTSSSHFLSTGELISISNVTGTGAGLVNTSHSVIVLTANSFSIPVDTTAQGPFSSGLVDNNTTLITVNDIPSNFSTNTPMDILKTKSPHTTLKISISAKSIIFISKAILFKTVDLPDRLTQGDTIACENETDIPGIPTELHRLLVSKVCERVMDALGDQAGIASAARKSSQSENAAQNYLENRVSSAPLKVKNTSGFLSRRNKNSRRF